MHVKINFRTGQLLYQLALIVIAVDRYIVSDS